MNENECRRVRVAASTWTANARKEKEQKELLATMPPVEELTVLPVKVRDMYVWYVHDATGECYGQHRTTKEWKKASAETAEPVS